MRSERSPILGYPDRLQDYPTYLPTYLPTYYEEGYNLEERRDQSHDAYPATANH